jgi:hypothetical protein
LEGFRDHSAGHAGAGHHGVWYLFRLIQMINFIKKNLHRDICQVPELHAFVMNLYLNGEEYPHKVNDYFPRHVVESDELLSKIDRHMADEDRHVFLYRKAIQKLEQPIVELPMDDVFNHVIKKHTEHCFQIHDVDSPDTKTHKLASFMAHLHYLEKRIAKSLDYHAEACQYSPIPYVEKAVNKVRSDELTHIEYTRQAVFDLLPRQKALDLLDLHRKAEQKANIEFSYQQLNKVVSHYRDELSVRHRWIYQISAKLLEWSLKYV